ncbi:MAG TPA: toxin-antitoxin system YwqK family antitoxin, partial [Cyclobacteriaceae bacterium]|nr:toxin-antitoxin system YwqK family antitoxin [Cyclobacteriaceae bacterium]
MRSLVLVFSFLPGLVLAQFKRYTYHDAEKLVTKEIYQVKDTIRNVLHGRYISYFLNGNIESKGQFLNNATSGVWEFYYETGNIKMRGILRQNSNYGLWEYFYENGQKSMEGNINNRLREGLWKIYYESGDLKESGNYVANKRSGLWRSHFQDGALKGEIEYVDDHGRYTEYYHSGKVLGEGPKAGVRNVGHWRFYDETSGTLHI